MLQACSITGIFIGSLLSLSEWFRWLLLLTSNLRSAFSVFIIVVDFLGIMKMLLGPHECHQLQTRTINHRNVLVPQLLQKKTFWLVFSKFNIVIFWIMWDLPIKFFINCWLFQGCFNCIANYLGRSKRDPLAACVPNLINSFMIW